MKYLGIIVMTIGAILLILKAFVIATQSNTLLIAGLVLVCIGYVVNIVLDKKSAEKLIR